MNKKDKIIFLIPELQMGGMERVMSELIEYFNRNYDGELYLVIYGINREVFYNVPSEVFIIKPNFKFNNNQRLFYTLRTLIFIRRTIKNLAPLSVLSFGEIWNNFILLSCYGLKYPIFISDRGQPDKKIGFIQELLRKILYPKATGIIAQTQFAKQFFLKQFKHDNIKVIANPIKSFSVGNRKTKENIVLSIGRLIKSKNHDQLINIFLKLNIEGWKLVIVGDDALNQSNRQDLEFIIKQNNAEHKIFLEGKSTNIKHYYKKSKIFAFTSSSEGFPNVLGEAMSAQLAVIAYDCVAGPSDMIENEINGLLIPLFDASQFGFQLKRLIENEELRDKLGLNAANSIKRYNLEKVGHEYKKFMLEKR